MTPPGRVSLLLTIRCLQGLLLSFIFTSTSAPAQKTDDRSDLAREIECYYGARTVVDLTIPQLQQEYPELEGLQPAKSQDELGRILDKVGGNVSAFFHNLSNTCSVEEVRHQRLNSKGRVAASIKQKFQYLVLTDPEKNLTMPEEYRTDNKGKPIQPHVLVGRLSLITQGFTASPVYFDPAYRSEADFRYLGTEDSEGRPAYIVAFAQRPQTARILAKLEVQRGLIRSAVILVQGVAWIDQQSFQILELMTDLLKPRDDFGLTRDSTQIQFAPVRFTQDTAELWLPKEVVVSIEWRGKTYRNDHRYSDYRLFTVQTEQHPSR